MQYTIWGEEMPESIGVFSSQSSSICTMSRHSQQDKCCKKRRRGEECKKLQRRFSFRSPAVFFSRNSPQKMGKKHCCVEFAVVNFVGRIKTAIKKVFSDLLDL